MKINSNTIINQVQVKTNNKSKIEDIPKISNVKFENDNKIGLERLKFFKGTQYIGKGTIIDFLKKIFLIL